MDFLSIAVGCIFGFAIAFLFLKSNKNLKIDTSELDAKIVSLDKEKLILQTNLVNSENQNNRMSIELKDLKEQFNSEINNERSKYLFELNIEKEKLSKAEARIARAEEIYKSQEEKNISLKSDYENLHKKTIAEFENIANKILDEKSQKFTDQNKTNLDIILNPLKEKIKDFESKVEKAYKAESDERISLKLEIKTLLKS